MNRLTNLVALSYIVLIYIMPTISEASLANRLRGRLDGLWLTQLESSASFKWFHFIDEGENGGELSRGGAIMEQYDNRAYPANDILPSEQSAAQRSFRDLSKASPGTNAKWEELGPIDPFVNEQATYTGRPTYDSGRITALALSPTCRDSGDAKDNCVIFIAAAGGGVWRGDQALSDQPKWASSNKGIPSNSLGSIIFDPTDKRARTLYAGTGEPNGSSDSEAGVGLYKSSNLGSSWVLVPGSKKVADGRALGAIAVDPSNRRHIFIGTAVARHGSSSVNGGRMTPPNAPAIGLYESTNGGSTFKLVFSKPADPVDPSSPNGSDFFRGGVTNIQFYGSDIYFSMMDYGLYRRKVNGVVEMVFASSGGGLEENSIYSRTEFSQRRNPTGVCAFM